VLIVLVFSEPAADSARKGKKVWLDDSHISVNVEVGARHLSLLWAD